MARNNFWNDVVSGMQVGQRMMDDAARAGRESREFERKEKAWEQEDAVDSALANAPKEVTTVAPKYKVGDQEFSTLDEAAKTSALLNESAPGSATIQPADASGNAVSGWREAAKSDQYKDAVRTLQSKGYGLAADKVHSEYGKAVTQELKKAINKAAATGDWSETMSIYNNKVGDNFDGRMEKGADGKLHFYSKGKDGKEVLSNTFDNNADAAAYYSSIEDGKLHDYWKTNVVSRENQQLRRDQMEDRKIARREALAQADRHHQEQLELRVLLSKQNGGGSGSGSSGGKQSADVNDGMTTIDNAFSKDTQYTTTVDGKPVDVKAVAALAPIAKTYYKDLLDNGVPPARAAQYSIGMAQNQLGIDNPSLKYAPSLSIDPKTGGYQVQVRNGADASEANLYKSVGNPTQYISKATQDARNSELSKMRASAAYNYAGGDAAKIKNLASMTDDQMDKQLAEKSAELRANNIDVNAYRQQLVNQRGHAQEWVNANKPGKAPDASTDDKTDKGTTTRAGKFFGDIADNYSKGAEAQRLRRENDPIRKKFAEHWDYLFSDQVPR